MFKSCFLIKFAVSCLACFVCVGIPEVSLCSFPGVFEYASVFRVAIRLRRAVVGTVTRVFLTIIEELSIDCLEEIFKGSRDAITKAWCTALQRIITSIFPAAVPAHTVQVVRIVVSAYELIIANIGVNNGAAVLVLISLALC